MDLGVIGNTYQIAEQDAVEQIKESSKNAANRWAAKNEAGIYQKVLTL